MENEKIPLPDPIVLKIIEKRADRTSLFIAETGHLRNFVIRRARNMIGFTLSLFYVINDVGVGKVRALSAKIFAPDALQGDWSARWGHRKTNG